MFKVKNSKCYVHIGTNIVNRKYLKKSAPDKFPPFYLQTICKNIINLAIMLPIINPINNKIVKYAALDSPKLL
jgi:hypothetical protein